MYWCKVYRTKENFVVAICDENLIGKKLKYGKVSVVINKNFYGGKLIDEIIAIKIMNKATIGNFIGKNIIELAEKNGFIARENIILIDGTPHAQFVKI